MRRAFPVAALAVLGGILAWVLFVGLPRWYERRAAPAEPAVSTPAPVTAERRITGTLYFISEDGLALVGVQREIPFGEQVADQAHHVVAAQLGAAAPPLASAIPGGTTLRSVFVSPRGDAFVDVSGEIATRHGGGALNELFTVYAIVNALTTNLPSIERVQVLVEGREVDTIAGHVDVRHPLRQNLRWVRTDDEN